VRVVLSHCIGLVPTAAQEGLLRQAVGVSRFAFNLGTRRRISVATQSIGLVLAGLESTPVERKALALLLRQRETSLVETGTNRASFDGHGLSNGRYTD